MRFEGTLKTWNAERGFGFITPLQGGQELFVHITAFPRNTRPPTADEKLSFEVETGADGKKRAVRVQRPGEVERHASAGHPPSRRKHAPREGRLLSGLIMLVIVAVLGWYGYGQYELYKARRSVPDSPAPMEAPTPSPATAFHCDGRTYCSQMTSCSEAKFFLRNCPGVKMDGNNDGVPCEQQWCTSPFAK